MQSDRLLAECGQAVVRVAGQAAAERVAAL